MDPRSAVEQALRDAGFRVVPADSPLRPTYIGTSPELGILAVEVVHGENGARKELNRKVAQLRSDVDELATVPIARRIVDTAASSAADPVVTMDSVLDRSWLQGLAPQPVPDSAAAAIAEQASPILSFVPSRRTVMDDAGAEARAEYRLLLDGEQAAIAQHDSKGVLLITGPPGSGKTLVLAARARWLAHHHPQWRIQLLCYNRLLVPYLKSLVEGLPNVNVNTFGKFSYANGFRIALDSEEKSAADVAKAVRAAYPVTDALLIDEWQDFYPSWLVLLHEMLFPGRGGMTLAGDPEQALYRNSGEAPDFLGVDLSVATLFRPYRSTRQILETTRALDPDRDLGDLDAAPEGEPCDLVWAENPREQASSIARDIVLLLQGGHRRPSQIGILYTRRWQLGGLVGALRDAGVPFHVAKPKDAAVFRLDEETVKVVTVHSAKGYEFDVVFLAGLEALPDPDGTEEVARQGRAGYVGATRARDQLVMTYTKENDSLTRIRSLPEEILRRWVWPDDYPDA